MAERFLWMVSASQLQSAMNIERPSLCLSSEINERRSAFLVQVRRLISSRHLYAFGNRRMLMLKILRLTCPALDSRPGLLRYLGLHEGLDQAPLRCREAIDV